MSTAISEVFPRDCSSNTEVEGSGHDESDFELEEVSDKRLWRACVGASGMFRVDFGNTSVFVYVRCDYDIENSLRPYTQIYLVSYWVDGVCKVFIEPPKRGERRPFLPFPVLFGEFDSARLPSHLSLDERQDLILDAEIICPAMRYYHETCRGRSRKNRAH